MEKKEKFVEGILQILVRKSIVTEQEAEKMESAFQDSAKEQFDEFLLDEELVSVSNLLSALAVYYQVPAFDVVGYFFDTHQLRKFPKGVLLRSGFIPLEVDENIMIVVASDPNDPDLLAIIGDNVSYDIQFRVGLRGDINDAIKEFYDKSVTEGKADDIHHSEQVPFIEQAKKREREQDDQDFVRYQDDERD